MYWLYREEGKEQYLIQYTGFFHITYSCQILNLLVRIFKFREHGYKLLV